MRNLKFLTIVFSVGVLCLATHSAQADLTHHAAAGTNSFDVFDSDDKFDGTPSNGGAVWEIGNVGPYAASISRTGSSTNQTFSGSADVDGSDSRGVLKAFTQVNDTNAQFPNGDVGVSSRAVWQDTLYLDDAAANFGDDLTVVVGASAALAADSDNFQETQTRVIVYGGNASPFGITASSPSPAARVIADAEDGFGDPENGWDGDLLPHWAATPRDAGWETFTSSVLRDDDALSFSGTLEGTTAFSVDHLGMQDGQHVYEFKVVLEAYGYTEKGTVVTNAGSSLDILGFRDAGGAALDPALYSFESGMTLVPEPSAMALLAAPGVLMLLGRRRAARR